MKVFRVFIKNILIIALSAIVVYFLLSLFISNQNKTDQKSESIANQTGTTTSINLVAIGDSLTEGVGDSTKRGGYVPLIAEQLRSNPSVRSVQTQNFGNAGDTTDQLLTLLKNNEEVRTELSRANIITLTIGGNDIVNNLDRVGLDGSMENFESTLQSYEQNLNIIFSILKELNNQATIYIYGLYNPYHYYFTEFSQLQEVFDNWNASTRQIVEEKENVLFVEIDSLFNPAVFPNESNTSSGTIEDVEDIEDENHPYLYKEDLFHPNDRGYQIMADALYDVVEAELKSQPNQLTDVSE